MKKTAYVITVALVLIFIRHDSVLAATSRLLEMAGTQTGDMSRISFVFDHIPEFEIKRSGQRVRVILHQTRIADSFQKISGSAASTPLVQVKTSESEEKSVVGLYFQDIPEFVDVAADARNSRFTVNVFWDRKGIGSRPAIMDKRLGRLKPIQDGAVAEKIVDSEYSGRWIDFFKEFEWAPNIEIPINFSFRDPALMVKENRSFFPEKFQQQVKGGFLKHAAQLAANSLKEGAGGRQADFFRLLLAGSLLRQKESSKAREVLGRIPYDPNNGDILAWKAYYKAYSLALQEKYFQAARVIDQREKPGGQANGIEPWISILSAELALAGGSPQKAIHYLEADFGGQEKCLRAAVLRRADANYAIGRFDKATDEYAKLATDLIFLRKHPASLANWATLLYTQKREYDRAYRYFFLLSEAIKNRFPNKQKLVEFWSAMAQLGSGQRNRALLILWEVDETAAGYEAGFRAWLKLIDLDVIGDKTIDFKSLIPEYRDIIERADARQLREEAYFKQILAAHLAGDDLLAVKMLGRFFDDYWAGELMPDARALFAEIFPGVVIDAVNQKTFFEALTLVAKHRDLLAQTRITSDFLHELAESYCRAGFLEQAAATYLYIMDFEEKPGKREKPFLPLIRIYHQQKNYDQVVKHASAYLKRYSSGADRTRILYFYAQALMEKGDIEKAAELLHENKRPHTRQLDYLAGRLFFETKRYELAQRYLAWAAYTEDQDLASEIRFKRAEALLKLKARDKAVPLYERLLAESGYRGAAALRLVQIYSGSGQNSRALNICRKMTEMDIQEHWLELANAEIEFDHSNYGE